MGNAGVAVHIRIKTAVVIISELFIIPPLGIVNDSTFTFSGSVMLYGQHAPTSKKFVQTKSPF